MTAEMLASMFSLDVLKAMEVEAISYATKLYQEYCSDEAFYVAQEFIINIQRAIDSKGKE